MSRKKDDVLDFEKAIDELNAIVESMEAGGLPLEEALKQFEKGISLTRQCQTILKEAEQRVQILIQQNGNEALKNYSEEQAS